MWLMKTLLTSRCINQLGAGQTGCELFIRIGLKNINNHLRATRHGSSLDIRIRTRILRCHSVKLPDAQTKISIRGLVTCCPARCTGYIILYPHRHSLIAFNLVNSRLISHASGSVSAQVLVTPLSRSQYCFHRTPYGYQEERTLLLPLGELRRVAWRNGCFTVQRLCADPTVYEVRL